jgi:hypothetical protein
MPTASVAVKAVTKRRFNISSSVLDLESGATIQVLSAVPQKVSLPSGKRYAGGAVPASCKCGTATVRRGLYSSRRVDAM